MPGGDRTYRPSRDLAAPPAATAGRDRWCVARADRAAVLVDAAAYYQAVRETLRAARRSVYIVGWDVDGRTGLGDPLHPPEDGLPLNLRDFLTALVHRNPDLDVHILLWDFTVLYSLDRELLPSVSLGWATPPQIHLGLDDAVPLEAAQHEKLVVVDDAVAFCGGMDLALRRWDTSAHDPDDPRRVTPGGEAYVPVHDVQMVVDGEAAWRLGVHVRDRWRLATGRILAPPPTEGDPWPPSVTPEAGPLDVVVARTRALYHDQPGTTEIRNLYLGAIERAERFIYIENQYLASQTVAKALARRLDGPSPPEVVMVTTREHTGWLEDITMGAAQVAFLDRLRRSGGWDRVRAVYPWVGGDPERHRPVKVHSKLMVVDDTFLTVGSANLANRSMGLDCEINLAVEAREPAAQAFVAAVRNRLLGEHTGAGMKAVAEHLSQGGSLCDVVDRLGDGRSGRGLHPLASKDVADLQRLEPLVRLGDPERPIDLEEFLVHEAPPPLSRDRRPVVRHLWIGVALLAGLAALFVLWRYTALAEMVDAAFVENLIGRLRQGAWTPLLVVAIYTGLGLMLFPVTVLIAATAAIFGPWWGFAYAFLGSLSSAMVAFALGHVLGRDVIRRYAGHTVNRLSQRMGRHGILSVVILRVAPVAPFTVVNLIAGASHVRTTDFVVGTVLGMLPGITLMTVFGTNLVKLLHAPEPVDYLIIAGVLAAWVGVSILLQRVASRVRERRARTE